MYELKVKNASGETLNLSTSKDYTVYKITGLNPPKAAINTSVNTTQDGSKVNSTRLENRNLVLYLAINGEIEKNRIGLYKYFSPKSNVSIYFKNGTRNVYIDGVVEVIECDMFKRGQIAQISIICPKPYFNDVDALVTSFSDVSSMFSFPFSIASGGMELSIINPNIRKSIINAGDIETGIIIELFAIGTVVNPVLYDVGRQTFIKLLFTLQSSDKIVINTNVGEKSITLVRNGISTNALGYLSPDSTWLVLGSGDNVFTYDCDAGNSNLQIKFTTATLYGGV